MAVYNGTGGNNTYNGTADPDSISGNGGSDTLAGAAGNDTIFGGTGGDSLSGGDDNDIVNGDSGNDTLFGGNGSDTLNGGIGNDTIDGDAGNDTVTYATSLLGVVVNLAAGTATGDGSDTLVEIENVIGSNQNDTITGSTADNVLSGGGGADSISAGDGNDTLIGGTGNDTLVGGAGLDTVDYAASATAVTVNLATGTATGEGTDTISQIENVTGSNLADSITGNSENNVIAGGGGNDTITAGFGSDTITGGDGNDSIVAGPDAAGTTPLSFNWDTYADEADLSGAFTQDTGGVNVAVSYSGGVGGATFTAETTGNTSGNERDYEIYSAGGEPFNPDSSAELFRPADGGGTSSTSVTFDFSAVAGSGFASEVTNVQFRISDIDRAGFTDMAMVQAFDANGVEIAVTVTETSASLTVSGNTVTATGGAATPNDVNGSALFQIAGPVSYFVVSYTDLANAQQAIRVSDIHFDAVATDNDVVDGGTGDDTVTGGFGDDTLTGDIGADRLFGGTGIDSLSGGDGDDSLDGGDGDDTLDGGIGNDTMLGGQGNDQFSGGDGADSIDGGIGDDTINFGAGDDTVFGGDGNDQIDDVGGTQLDGANLIDGGVGNDTIWSGLGNDTLYGGDDNDSIVGESGNDSLFGDAGDDTLEGGDGDDVLDGGAGADNLDGGAGRDTIVGGIGDTVNGSEAGVDEDVLDLTAFGKAATNIIFDENNDENGTVEFLDGNGDVIGTMAFSNIETVVPCFAPGTRIATDRGPRAVEHLRIGDRVLTRDSGFRPITWIGQRNLTAVEVARQPALVPVLIARGALGHGLPDRDLVVSPQHRMLISGTRAEMFFGEHEVLVPAVHLVGRPGITRMAPEALTYIHVMCERHEILRAEGAWTESFQPGARTLRGMEAGVRAELLSLFPELADSGGYPAARLTLKAHETRVLLAA